MASRGETWRPGGRHVRDMASVLSSGTATNQGGQEETRLELPLPPGFCFHPTDDEIVMSYLRTRQATLNSSFPSPAIAEVDIYNIDPWVLPGKAKMGEKEWYFFCHKDRKYPKTGMRTNRATRTGYWKATGKDKEIFSGHSALVGMKKSLVSYTGRAPIEHQTGVDVSTNSTRVTAEYGRLGQGQDQFRCPRTGFHRLLPGEEDQDEPHQFRSIWFISPTVPERHHLLMEIWNWKNPWHSAHDDRGFNIATTKEEDPVRSSVGAPKPLVRSSTGGVIYKIPWAIRLEIIQAMASALRYIHSSLDRPIHFMDLKPSNVLLDEETENQLSDFGFSSRLQCANDYAQIPMGSVVPTDNGSLDAKFLGKPSAKHGIGIKTGSHMTHWRTYLSVHHHPLIKMWLSALKRLADIITSFARLITSKRTFATAEAGWTHSTPHSGPVSEYIRKLFGIRNELTVNESQQHSDPDSRRAENTKMALNRATSASWIVATAAPHHATGDRNLLSGFTMEHDDLFVHTVNRVPMKVLARGAVVTDELILPDVWFVPGLTENLVSVSQLAELDHSIGFGRGECCVRSAPDTKIVGKGRLQKDGQYVLDYLKVPLAI